MYRMPQLTFDGFLPFGQNYFAAANLMHVEAVNCRAFLRADARGRNVQLQLGQRLGDGVQQAGAVAGAHRQQPALTALVGGVGLFCVSFRTRMHSVRLGVHADRSIQTPASG